MEIVWDIYLFVSKITVDGNCSHEIKEYLLLGRKAMTNLDSNIIKQRYNFADKGPYNQSYGFSSSHVEMWDLDHKKRLRAKELMLSNCSAGEDCWESLGQQGNQTFNPNGNQPWIFIEKTEAEAEAPILWSPDTKGWLIEKDPDAEKD